MTVIPFNADMLRRASGACLVLLLHLIAIAFLLRATLIPTRHVQFSQENAIWFVLPRRTKPQPLRIIAVPRDRANPLPRDAITVAPSVPGFTAHGDLHALLFDCAPEDLANLPPERRAQCLKAPGSAPSDTEVYAEHGTRSNNAAHWARGVARKHQPLLLPCANPQSIFATFSLATLMCLAHAAKEGKFDVDELPGYGDTPEDIHVPNNGDPPDRPPG
jgi:hypothetical protein